MSPPESCGDCRQAMIASWPWGQEHGIVSLQAMDFGGYESYTQSSPRSRQMCRGKRKQPHMEDACSMVAMHLPSGARSMCPPPHHTPAQEHHFVPTASPDILQCSLSMHWASTDAHAQRL